jgi:hypothetical protein
MATTKVSIQFASLYDLWCFRTAIKLNVFFVNISERLISFEYDTEEPIGWAVEKYAGQIRSMEEA